MFKGKICEALIIYFWQCDGGKKTQQQVSNLGKVKTPVADHWGMFTGSFPNKLTSREAVRL